MQYINAIHYITANTEISLIVSETLRWSQKYTNGKIKEIVAAHISFSILNVFVKEVGDICTDCLCCVCIVAIREE